MGQVHHGCATTTAAVRRAIQHSQESLRALAKLPDRGQVDPPLNELAGQPDRHVSEYVIIGTLASYAWAIAVGYAARGALQALGALPGA
ncbi:hypothetical protein CNY89_13850 [Amaricoccus sp. HAR-UPW-R2A-40]|nr:hypothetical protein CNY89_13850 [Amaricoccus sp. HAR-UPW-R2A-40]